MNMFLDYECLVSMNQPRLVQDFTAKFFVKVIFTMITFRKNVHADFYGYLDVNFVVSVFDSNVFPQGFLYENYFCEKCFYCGKYFPVTFRY